MFVDIQCPSCQVGTIQIEPHMLAQGASFRCSCCNAKVSVAPKSQQQVVQGVEAYDAYREKLNELQRQGNNPEFSA